MRIYSTQGRASAKTAALLRKLEQRGGSALDDVMPVVRKMLDAVRKKGNEAVLSYAREFDGLGKSQEFLVAPEETAAAWRELDPLLKQSLEMAATNIRAFAERQMPASWNAIPMDGLVTGQLIRPVESAGCYVPGGRHPLPSTMLMTVIPAQVAGVNRIVVTSPRPAAETLATAHMLGIKEFYRIGGAHAIAALAHGTESIPRVVKIVGPGNSYVTAAKRVIAAQFAPGIIDMLAGPTEIVVTSDRGSAPNIAADLVAQAEHDPEALAIFITTNEALAGEVLEETKACVLENATAREALRNNGYILLAADSKEAQNITNRLAPEHLTVDSVEDLDWIRNAGSVFIGDHSPQPMGDYISGPNHTLPTGGTANVRGGLSVMDFVKLITVQQYTEAGLARLGPHAIRLADAEGLVGHAKAIRNRLATPVTATYLKPHKRVRS